MSTKLSSTQVWLRNTLLDSSFFDSNPNKNSHTFNKIVVGEKSLLIEEFLNRLAISHVLSAPIIQHESEQETKEEPTNDNLEYILPVPSVDAQQPPPQQKTEQVGGEAGKEWKGKVVFLDVLKVLKEYVAHYKKMAPNVLTRDIKMQDSMKYFGQTLSASGLLEKEESNASNHIQIGCSLLSAINVLLQFKCHRVLVLDEKHEMKSIFTQSDFVQLLGEKIAQLEDFPSGVQITNCEGIVSKDLITVTTKQTAFEALEVFSEKPVGALIVVDPENNKFIDTVAAADFRGFHRDNWMLLEKPVLDYKHYSSPRKSVTCTQESTLGEVIDLVCKHKVKQICVLDSQSHPVGIITLSDIIGHVAKL